jgi:hypothetical protein
MAFPEEVNTSLRALGVTNKMTFALHASAASAGAGYDQLDPATLAHAAHAQVCAALQAHLSCGGLQTPSSTSSSPSQPCSSGATPAMHSPPVAHASAVPMPSVVFQAGRAPGGAPASWGMYLLCFNLPAPLATEVKEAVTAPGQGGFLQLQLPGRGPCGAFLQVLPG